MSETPRTPHPAETAEALQMEGRDRARAAAARERELIQAKEHTKGTQAGDSWAHRSAGMRCSSCMYFVPKADTGGALGRCRRHAPTMSGFPVVYPADWCGDHKLAAPPA